MKKYLSLIIIIPFLLLFFNKASGAKEQTQSPVELTFWHSMSIYQGDILERMIEEYNAQHSNIKIKPVFQGLYDEMKTKLINATKTNSLPDIAQVAIEYLDIFIYDGKIEPITESIPDEDKADILSQFWNGVSREREIYAIPFNQSVQVLYYNKNAFEKSGLDPDKPPKTWKEVIEYGKILTIDRKNDGTVDQWGILISVEGVFGFTPLIRQVGGDFLNDDRTKALFNSDKGIKVMNLLQDMVYKYRIMPKSWTLFEGTNAFLEGKIAMGPITCAGIKFAEENLPWDLGIAPLPYIENKSVLLGGAGLVIFSTSPTRRRYALDFERWLTSRENTIRWHMQTGYLPLRKSAIESIQLQSFHHSNPNYKVPVDQLPYSRPPDFTPFLPQIDKIVRFAIEDIIINKKDPKWALNFAAEKVNELLQKKEKE